MAKFRHFYGRNSFKKQYKIFIATSNVSQTDGGTQIEGILKQNAEEEIRT
jgi:hypothetical protein